MINESIIGCYFSKDENFIGIIQTNSGFWGIHWFGFKYLPTELLVGDKVVNFNVDNEIIEEAKTNMEWTILKLSSKNFLKFGPIGIDAEGLSFSDITLLSTSDINPKFLEWFENDFEVLTMARSSVI